VHLVRTNGSGDVLLQLSADQGATVSAEVTPRHGVRWRVGRVLLPGRGRPHLRGGNVYCTTTASSASRRDGRMNRKPPRPFSSCRAPLPCATDVRRWVHGKDVLP
jgi:hypothetical protein